MAKKSHHVVPAPRGGWSVKKSGAERALKHFENKKDAIRWAREVSRSGRTELFVHGRDGRIVQKDSYGQDHHPPRN